ncbi:MAG: hypothetical protein QOE76_2399 [Frankiales bacterium]|jgi:putative FmdB family regulatory protein|nr:hypothetical protein [Frankiales bacterium]
MPSYDYRCTACADFVISRPMSAVTTAPAPCPQCGAPSARVFRAPGVTRTPADLGRALAGAEASADSPAVVRSSPSAARRPIPSSYPPLPRP